MALLTLLPLSAYAEEEGNKVGFALEVGVNKELPKGFEVGLFGEVHTCQTFNVLEHYCFIAHGGYEILPWLHTEVGYQFLHINNAEDREDMPLGWSIKHRVFAGLEGGYGVKGFSFAIRERYDFTTNPFSHVLRSRLNLEYEFQKAPIGIFANAELLNEMTQKFRIGQVFYRLGMEWHVNDLHTLELTAGYNAKDFLEEERGFLVELGYEFEF